MNRSQQLVLGCFAFAWVALVVILVVGTRNSLPKLWRWSLTPLQGTPMPSRLMLVTTE